MRVAFISESFYPAVNGVTNSVARAAEHLAGIGHEVQIIAPGPGPESHAGIPVTRVRSFQTPLYKGFSVARGKDVLAGLLQAYQPDLVHLASPIILGWHGVLAANSLGIPAVAVFQTDVPGFAQRYGAGVVAPAIWSHLRRLHNRADLTLAPSTATQWMLAAQGIQRVQRWGRGVDLDGFTPIARCEQTRRELAPGGEVIVGYVGRLSKEKGLEHLAAITALPGVQVVIVGDGPARAALQRHLPRARFTGQLNGPELCTTLAGFDVFVHPGRNETYCQAVQEALACGVPVVASANGGPLDLVRHGVNGYLWADGDAAVLGQIVESLIRDPELRARMSVAARDSVRGRSWPALGQSLTEHYRAVLRSGARITASTRPSTSISGANLT